MLINSENIKKNQFKNLNISNIDKWYPDLDLKTFYEFLKKTFFQSENQNRLINKFMHN